MEFKTDLSQRVVRQTVMLMPNVMVPLTVRDLIHDDLPSCTWCGSTTHLAHVAQALGRAERGEVDYLAVCPPSNLPVAIDGIDHTVIPGAGHVVAVGRPSDAAIVRRVRAARGSACGLWVCFAFSTAFKRRYRVSPQAHRHSALPPPAAG